MEGAKSGHRYTMVNVRPGYVIVEHEVFSKAMRSYFSAEARPPVEEYREGAQIWKYSGMAQSFQFDLRDCVDGQVTRFDDLLGLVPYTACPETSDIHRIGDLAQAEKVWIYVALSHRPDGGQAEWLDKLKLLNRYFGERLTTPNKKVLILPDYFGLYREFSHGQIMADFGLTSMEA
ncbi:MAG: hypothetical protein ACM3NQ_14180 [Bacteroidales bacterium]